MWNFCHYINIIFTSCCHFSCYWSNSSNIIASETVSITVMKLSFRKVESTREYCFYFVSQGLSLFNVALTKYLRMGNLWSKDVHIWLMILVAGVSKKLDASILVGGLVCITTWQRNARRNGIMRYVGWLCFKTTCSQGN